MDRAAPRADVGDARRRMRAMLTRCTRVTKPASADARDAAHVAQSRRDTRIRADSAQRAFADRATAPTSHARCARESGVERLVKRRRFTAPMEDASTAMTSPVARQCVTRATRYGCCCEFDAASGCIGCDGSSCEARSRAREDARATSRALRSARDVERCAHASRQERRRKKYEKKNVSCTNWYYKRMCYGTTVSCIAVCSSGSVSSSSS